MFYAMVEVKATFICSMIKHSNLVVATEYNEATLLLSEKVQVLLEKHINTGSRHFLHTKDVSLC